MTANYVGADGQSYPEVAARAIRSVHAQHRSPLYGYVRTGMNQRIYLFPLLEDARTWFDQELDGDYVAVFSASNLRGPIAGLERFSGPRESVGNLWPFLLGLPLGGLGGYFLRRWQEPPTTRAQVPLLRDVVRPLLPGGPAQLPAPAPPVAGYSVGCPSWVGQAYGYDDDGYDDGYDAGNYGFDAGDYADDDSYGYSVGCPSWVGQDTTAQRGDWPQTRALIQSAIDAVAQDAGAAPGTAAWVWSLEAPSSDPYQGSSGARVIPEPTVSVMRFATQPDALDYLRTVAQQRPAALAMFERSSPHWPNPVAWRKGREPVDEQAIAIHLANQAPAQMSGVYAGADVQGADKGLGAAIDDLRRRAQSLAERRAGSVVGAIHTSKDGLWHTLAFRTADDADEWLDTATQDQAAYTYAAYFDKDGDSWPAAYIEKIGGFRKPSPAQQARRSVGVGR